MFQLEVVNTALAGKKIPILDGLIIGSQEGCGIRAKGADMQPQHARFYKDGGVFFIEVCCQEAHVHRNGKDILRAELHHQDSLSIGPLRFRVIDTAAKTKVQNRLDQLLEKLEESSEEDIYDFAQEDLFYLTTKDPMLRQRIRFTIPSRDRFIDQCQAFLARLVRQSGMDEMKVEAFMTCAKELILNAHRHGHEYDESKVITITYRDLGDRVELTITDQGTGFDHKKVIGDVTAVDAAAAARARYQSGGFGGLGFQMITRLSDELVYNEVGNEVRFAVNKEF